MRSHGGPWERGYPDVFGPAEQGNLAAALMHLENSRAPEELRRGIQLLLHWLHAPEQASLRRAFTVWLGRVLLPGKLKGVDLPALNELEEVDAMLAERVKEWTREWEQQGLLKGLQQGLEQGLETGREQGLEQGLERGMEQGREQGRKEGEVELLKKQLLRKFGPLSPQTEQRLEQAGPDELLEWGEKILFAASIEQVFDDG